MNDETENQSVSLPTSSLLIAPVSPDDPVHLIRLKKSAENILMAMEKFSQNLDKKVADLEELETRINSRFDDLNKREQQLLDAIENARRAERGYIGLDDIKKQGQSQDSQDMTEIMTMFNQLQGMINDKKK
jgi:hypothetical protein